MINILINKNGREGVKHQEEDKKCAVGGDRKKYSVHYLPLIAVGSGMPYFSNSVYSMQVIPYAHSPSRFSFSVRTFTPSVAPGLRSQDAKPNF